MDYYQKYITYKTKYLILKETYKTKLDGGGCKTGLIFKNNLCELLKQTECTMKEIGYLDITKKKDIYDLKKKQFKCKPTIDSFIQKKYTNEAILNFDYLPCEKGISPFIYTVEEYILAGFTINDIMKVYKVPYYSLADEQQIIGEALIKIEECLSNEIYFTRIIKCFNKMSYANLTDDSFKMLFTLLNVWSFNSPTSNIKNLKHFDEIKETLKSKKKDIIDGNKKITEIIDGKPIIKNLTDDEVCKRIIQLTFGQRTIDEKSLTYVRFTALLEFIISIFEINFEKKFDYLLCKTCIERDAPLYTNYYQYLIEKINSLKMSLEDIVKKFKANDIDPIIFILKKLQDKLLTKTDLEKIGISESNPKYFYVIIEFFPDKAQSFGLTLDKILKLDITDKNYFYVNEKIFYYNFKKIVFNELTNATKKTILEFITNKLRTWASFDNKEIHEYRMINRIKTPIFLYQSFKKKFIEQIKEFK